MPEAIWDEIRSDRVRRDELIPVSLASHVEIKLPLERMPEPVEVGYLLPSACHGDVLEGGRLDYELRKIIRYRDVPV